MKFMDFFKRGKTVNRDLQTTEMWASYLNGATSVNTESGVTSIATAYRCIAVVSETVGQLSGDILKKVGKRTESEDHELYELLFVRSSEYVNAYNFRRQLVYDYLIYGNGYALIHRKGGKIVSFENIYLDVYESDGYIFYHSPIKGKYYEPHEVIHLADMGSNVHIGKSKIKQHALTFGKAAASSEFSNLLYSNNLILGGVIEYGPEVQLETEKKESLAQHIRSNYGGKNQGKVLVLDQGAKWKAQASSMALDDAQYVESEGLTREDICRIFGVPPFKVFHFNKMTYDNMEAMKVEFAESCILPIVIQLEQEINNKAFTPTDKLRKIFVKLEIKSLLRADLKSQAEYFSKMVSIGAMNINEVRELNDLNPVAGGDTPLIQINNLFPLDKLDEYVAAIIAEKQSKAEYWTEVTNSPTNTKQ